ncbi:MULTISPECIES: hypothetical protein [Archangium]|uniref:Uncharacterized protein n=1 Tax=Archangium violaceum Cb vi76 TaxID=1406225 RepID=A0A084SQN0_9BACT|nr:MULTISPECIES: hypothetical protein [Archangium]KFA90765.1 hypothetical protein Q664_26385 [Archangium violaceum Cb vi76]OJT25799.1 hypothetical protein BO221_08075 [Archangium sp. Cb G35]
MADHEKRRKYDPVHPKEREDEKPPFSPDRVERGLEADDTLPLYSADSIHGTREQKFALDSDAEVGGYVPDIRSPIDEADEEIRILRGQEEREKDRD